jgi:hypothetical protein
MKVHQLPLVVFSHIRDYFVVFTIPATPSSYEDFKNWRNFCNCGHEFEEIKRFYCYYNLNHRLSAVYMSYCEALIYGEYQIVQRILKCITNSKLQISLFLADCDVFTSSSSSLSLSVSYARAGSVHSLKMPSAKWNELSNRASGLDGLHCLTIVPSLYDPVVCLNSLFDFTILRLSFCNFEYLNGYDLKKCLELDLSNTRTEDVAMLQHVRKLNLTSCQLVTDVSMLGGLHTLILDGCGGINDISALNNVYSLSFSRCDYILNGLSDDNTVRKLTISSNFLSTVCNYQNKKKKMLHVFGEFNVHQACFLDGYERVCIYQNGSLNGLFTIMIPAGDVPKLSSLKQLSLYDCSYFHYLRDFPYLSSLTLSRLYPFPDSIDFPSLPALRYLTLDNIVHLDDFVVHFPLKVLTFSNCKRASNGNSLVLHVYNVIDLLSIRSSALTVFISESGNGKVNEMISNCSPAVAGSPPSCTSPSFIFPASPQSVSTDGGNVRKGKRNLFAPICKFIFSFWRS